jgi:hypothetical protein
VKKYFLGAQNAPNLVFYIETAAQGARGEGLFRQNGADEPKMNKWFQGA